MRIQLQFDNINLALRKIMRFYLQYVFNKCTRRKISETKAQELYL